MLKYVGDGSFVPGLPARDLTDAETEKAGGEKTVLATGLYKKGSEEKAMRGGKENK